ncbi:MAG TPA: hypothetical protein VMB35_05610 [Methanomicrobiales archaeon]|nr:hypothetical protein [Methanomicrobiales archaeon]
MVKAGGTKTGKAKGKEQALSRVGMRNPNALAEIYLRRKINWKGMNHKGIKEVLEMAFQRDFGDLFDTSSGSPLYAKSIGPGAPRRGR